MASQSGRGNQPSKNASAQLSAQGGNFVNRFKIQKARIQALNQMEDGSSDFQKKVQQSLPKIHTTLDKESLIIRAVARSNTLDAIKLPGVNKDPVIPPKQRVSLPVKTYHLRVNPEHTSFISKSLPSLPSIPGSPSYPTEHAVSPISERDRTTLKVPPFVGKHRYENIVFQKQLHRESTGELSKHKPEKPHQQHKKGGGLHGVSFADNCPPDKPHTSGSIRIRYSKAPREVSISETQSEPSFEINRKWRENCRCLRCQMLKRQFMEGDSHYGLWGRYPCHIVDPSIMLDD